MPRLKYDLADLWTHSVPDFPRGLAFSPDGARLAVGAASGDVHLLEVSSGQTMAEIRLADSVSVLAFDPVGAQLAVGCYDGTARLLDPSGRQKATLPGHGKGWVEHLAWSKQGKLATASGRVLQVWSAEGTPLMESEPQESTISAIAFGAREETIYTACYGGVRRFPLIEGAEARHLPWKGSLISMAVSPDDSIIACGCQDTTVHFWRTADGADSEMSGYPMKPRALAWAFDSSLLATGGAEVITVWRFDGAGPEGTEPVKLAGHERLITHLAFSPGERLLASGGEDRDVLLWHLPEHLGPVAFAPMRDSVCELAFSPDGRRLAAVDAGGHLAVWEVMKQ